MAESKDASLIHREMYRRSLDVHRVKNPLNEPYRLVWDTFVDTIPANSTYDLETFKMEKYLREMSALIVRKKVEEELEAENQRRRDRGEKEMEKYQFEAQHILEGKITTKLNNPQELKKIYSELYLGRVKEYGTEQVEQREQVSALTTHEEIIGDLLSKKAPIEMVKPIPTDNQGLESMNQFKLRSLAKEKGIETSKTDKKAELIAKISKHE